MKPLSELLEPKENIAASAVKRFTGETLESWENIWKRRRRTELGRRLTGSTLYDDIEMAEAIKWFGLNVEDASSGSPGDFERVRVKLGSIAEIDRSEALPVVLATPEQRDHITDRELKTKYMTRDNGVLSGRHWDGKRHVPVPVVTVIRYRLRQETLNRIASE